ncbi:nucleoside hydrolase [Rhodobacteraceae bacterium]|nr:nucleoside hydrolase [Paracoccaceae bacterium]
MMQALIEPVVVDCDPGVDDALALAMILATPKLDLVGVTTVFGNLGIDQVTANAAGLLALAGRGNIPVAKGAVSSLTGKFSGGVPHVHGKDGLGDQSLLSGVQSSPLGKHHAAVQLVSMAKESRSNGGLTLVALGPLTNLALALQIDPEFDTYVKRVVLMGGNAFCMGNATPAAEANMLGDPEAADIVFGARWPVTMVGLDVTHKVLLSSEQLSRIAAQPGFSGSVTSRTVPFYQSFLKRMNGIDGIYCHDPSAVAFLLAPELFQTRALPVRVETKGISRGKIWPSLGDTDDESPEPWQDRPAIEICTDVQGPKVSSLIERALLES